MPSKHYEDLELLESGSSYIAPADGYYYLCKTATATNQSVKLTNEDNLMSCENISVGASNWCRSWPPVSKDTRITTTYTTAGETRFFPFHIRQQRHVKIPQFGGFFYCSHINSVSADTDPIVGLNILNL